MHSGAMYCMLPPKTGVSYEWMGRSITGRSITGGGGVMNVDADADAVLYISTCRAIYEFFSSHTVMMRWFPKMQYDDQDDQVM